MKKKILITLLIILLFIIIYFVYINLSFKSVLKNTINYESKINYSTIIELNLNNKSKNSKMIYDIKKSSNIKKVNIIYYINNKRVNNIDKYIIFSNNKQDTYVLNNKKYEKQKKSDDFYLNYELLNKTSVLFKKNNKYILVMKAYDAYNLIYNKQVIEKEKLNYYIIVIVEASKEDYINKIEYNINNINKSSDDNNILNYKVLIKNKNINNHDKIILPFNLNK